jgi:hypothetical protein
MELLYLYFPPPIPHMHVMKYTGPLITYPFILMLRSENQVAREGWIPVEGLYTLYNVTRIHYRLFAANLNFITLEGGTIWELVVDKVVQFSSILIRERECLNNLHNCLNVC